MENGQAGSTAFDHLDHCCRMVSEIYGKAEVSQWTNSDYVQLGYILHKKTRVQISPNTLKRIFGKIKTAERYFPQRATRDALAQYAGFKDWEHLTYTTQVQGITHEKSQPASVLIVPEDAPHLIRQQPKNSRKLWLFGGLLLLILVSFGGYKSFLDSELAIAVTLECSNPVGKNPHSAAFIVSGLPTSSSAHYSIDFGDGKKVLIDPDDSLYSHYYEVPGRFLAILKRDGLPLDSVPVYLKTNAWTATAEMMFDTTRVYPINTSNLFARGKNGVNSLEVSRAGVDTNRTFFVKFLNTQETDIDGDNFNLAVRLKTSAERPGVRCSQVRIIVFGAESNHFIDVMKPGCEHWTNMQFSEVSKPGEFNKLDFLGVDLQGGGTIALNVQKQTAKLSINSSEVFRTTYKKPLKKIYGLGITFSGIGQIESVSLKDISSGAAFKGNF